MADTPRRFRFPRLRPWSVLDVPSGPVVEALWYWQDRAGLAHTYPANNSDAYVQQWRAIRQLAREGLL